MLNTFKIRLYYGAELISKWKVKAIDIYGYARKLRPCMPQSRIGVLTDGGDLIYIVTARNGVKAVADIE